MSDAERGAAEGDAAARGDAAAGADGTAGSMAGKTVVITGASSGIGRAAAKALAGAGARVGVVGRNAERTRAVAHEVGGQAFIADFDRFSEVRSLADALLSSFDRIDVLANNAGGLVTKRELTPDGHERTLQSNHLSPFLLTTLLLDRLTESAKTAPVRVIQTSSSAAGFGRIDLADLDLRNRRWLLGFSAYGAAKLANILFTKELARRTAGTGVEAFAAHPGFVSTSFGSSIAPVRFANALNLGLSPEAGAVPMVHLASVADVGSPSGTFFDRLKPNGRTAKQADDAALAERFWFASERAIAR